MVRITISDELKEQLLLSDGVAELCDASGKAIAEAKLRENSIPSGWVPVTPELSEEELNRLSKEGGPTITSEELLARLRAKL